MLRDMQADWKDWTPTERIVLIGIGMLLAIAIPAVYLATLV